MSFEEIDKEKLPWYYRFILRLPKPVLEHLSPAWIHGIYWAIVMPLFLVFEFFLSLYLQVALPFPTNLVATLILPTIVFIVFVRIQLERFVNAWNAMIKKEPTEWNVDKTLREYLELLKKKEGINTDKHSDK